jgi:hypothetical protein
LVVERRRLPLNYMGRRLLFHLFLDILDRLLLHYRLLSVYRSRWLGYSFLCLVERGKLIRPGDSFIEILLLDNGLNDRFVHNLFQELMHILHPLPILFYLLLLFLSLALDLLFSDP